MAHKGGSESQNLPAQVHLLARNRCRPHNGQLKTLLGAPSKGSIPPEGKHPTAHIITFLDKLAAWVPSLDAWDQLVWPPAAALPWALTEAELYGYCCGQVVDLSLMMPVAQFWVMDEGGAYLCIVRALVFEGSVLAYNPAMNEAEWVPVCGLAYDLTWAKERSNVALANYVPHIPVEVARIARLGARRIVSWPDDPSTSEEEEAQHPELQTMDTEPERGEESEDGARQTDPEEEAEPNRQRCPQDWEAVMEGSEGLAYDDPWLDSEATVMGVDCPWGPVLLPHTPRHAAPCMLSSPIDHFPPLEAAIAGRDAVEVHVDEAELDNL